MARQQTKHIRGRGRGESKTSRRRMLAQNKAIEAIKLRTTGASYEQIARALGYADRSGAWYAIHRMLAKFPAAA